MCVGVKVCKYVGARARNAPYDMVIIWITQCTMIWTAYASNTRSSFEIDDCFCVFSQAKTWLAAFELVPDASVDRVGQDGDTLK